MASPRAQERVAQRDQIGRYRIVRQLGAGGMGIVWEAVDPELGRGVAIKVLREARLGSAPLAERLRREAQALARLHHPNVVAVYDVGVDDGGLYIVMQLIAGTTLDRAIANRSVREIVALCVGAGRGLEAAHAAGIVHRDFKPTNVLVDADGTPRVSDFGLARASEDREELAAEAGPSGLDTSMTRGELVGTPAYMAPEQYLGGPVTAATDQFAFCVTLWEALAGSRPFPGGDVTTLREAVIHGKRGEMPARIPRRFRAALARGLAVDPGERFASMTELLDELAPRRRMGWALGGIGAAALATATILLGVTRAPGDPCAGVEQPADAVWNDAQRQRVRASLGAQAGAVIAALDGRTARWKATRLDACRATRVREDAQTQAELDARYRCLDHALADERAAIELLGGKVDRVLLARAKDVVEQAAEPEACTRQAAAAALAARSKPAHVSAPVYAQLAHLRAGTVAGRNAEVIAAAPALTPQVIASGDQATLSEWYYALARAQLGVGDMPGARTSFRQSAEAALRAGKDDYATHAWTDLAIVSAQLGELDSVDDLLAAARGAASRIDPSDWEPGIWVELATAHVALERADMQAAQAGCERAAALAIQHTHENLTDEALGCELDVYLATDPAKAVEIARTLYDRATARFSPDHPHTLEQLRALATALQQNGDAAAARPLWERAIAGHERLYGPTSIELMNTLHDYAVALTPGGTSSTPEALAAIQRAVTIADKALGPKDPRHATELEALALVESALHHTDAAIAAYDRAIELYERTDDAAALARVVYNAADTLKESGHCDRAVPLFQRAAKVASEMGSQATMTAMSLYGVGACLGRGKQYAQAEVALQQSIDQLDKLDQPLFAAQSRWELADQLVQRGERAKGLSIARAAAAQLEGRPPPADALRGEIVKWIKKH